MAEKSSDHLDAIWKILGVLGTVVAFLWGVYTYQDTANKQLERERLESERYAETRRIEATKPFLERQLVLYTDAAQAAATLATSGDEAEKAKARKRFWELYWGELALVENSDVEAAMVSFGRGLREGGDQDELQQLSLGLAHACRNSLALSWNVAAWRESGSTPSDSTR
jgi:hypothetical protein